MKTLCGLDCAECPMLGKCRGCTETEGRPFGGSCMVAECVKAHGCQADSCQGECLLRKRAAAEVNALGIPDMEPVYTMHPLAGSFVNLEYVLPGGQQIRFWDDSRVYLGNQVAKAGSNRCYGITMDEKYLLVCEYGENGADPEIVSFTRR